MTYQVIALIGFKLSFITSQHIHWLLEKLNLKQEFYILNSRFLLLLDGKAAGNAVPRRLGPGTEVPAVFCGRPHKQDRQEASSGGDSHPQPHSSSKGLASK